MNRIKQLIEELCPDGVEYKELGEICENIISGKNKQRIETGEFPVYGSTGIIGHTDEYVFDEECLLIARVGANAGFVYRGKGKYDVSDNALIVRPKAIYNLSFGYYQLSFLGINKLAKGGGQPLITAGDIKKIQIPIPALPVQQEIVNILDKFTALDASLQAELEARRKQYEHYRNQLLNFEGKEVEWKTLGEISTNKNYKRIPITQSERKSGKYRYYGASGVVDYVDNYIFDGDYLLISEDGANLTARKTPIAFSVSGKFWVNNHAHVIYFENYYTRRLVEIYLNSIDLSIFITGAAQPKLNQENLYKIPIPIPPLSEQERIVGILDKFDALLNTELPAEIAARRKQYEYYREKLLTFEPLAN